MLQLITKLMRIDVLWREVSGGVAPLGHGKREGPAGDKSLRSEDAGNGGYSKTFPNILSTIFTASPPQYTTCDGYSTSATGSSP